MSAPAPETKDTAKKMTLGGIGKSLLGGAKKAGGLVKKLFSKKPTSELVVNEKTTPVEYLGEIFKMMKVMDEDKKLNHEMANNHLEEEEHKKDQRNKEIIQALTGKKFKKTKFKSKLKPKTKKKITAAKVSNPVGGGFSLGTLGTIAIGTAAVVGTGAVLMSSPSSAFANTIKMEHDVNNQEGALKKAHQSVPDTDNSLSYGVIGLSSRKGKDGTKKSSLESFIEDNPQFNLPSPGNGGHNEEFIKKWKQISAEELLAAQEKWYQKHVYDPTVRTIEKTGVDPKVASDERVRAYMADRANQIGTGGTEPSIKNSGAVQSKTAEEFINKMADYDIKNLDEDFPNYLKQHPENINGLIKRVERRKNLSLGINPNNEVKAIKKQPSSVEDLKIKEDTPTIQESLKETELQIQKSSNAQDVIELQRKMAGSESSSSSIPKSSKSPSNSSNASDVFKSAQIELESSGPIIPKPTMAPSDAEIEQKNYLENYKLRLQKMREEAEGPKLKEESEEEQLSLVQKENANLKVKEEVKNAEAEAQVMTNIIIQQNTQTDLPPPVEVDDNQIDAPVLLQTHTVKRQSTLEELQGK